MQPRPDVPDGQLPPAGRTFIAGFESTNLPGHGVDSVDLTGHAQRWRHDLDDLLAAGVRHLRYPLRWHRIEPEPGRYDWAGTDRVLGHLRDAGAVPIVDLVHHTSYPGWLSDGFRGADFGPAFVRYAEAVARRYPWLPAYTLFNEPFATLFLAGHEALWPPYDQGTAGFVRLLRSVLPPLADVAGRWARLLPDARHVWVDTAEHHDGDGRGAAYARMANDRRHVVLDLVLGHDLDPARPFLAELVAAGGAELLELPPVRVDVLGLDYYCHSEWFHGGDRSFAPSPRPVGLAAVAEQYGERYGLPMMLTETNIRGLPTDQVSWLRYTLEQYELARSRGVDLRGYCWFPQVDSCDWDSLLARAGGRVDPVGVLGVGPDGSRVRTVFTDAWEAAAAGAPVEELPAYRFQSPCDELLAGLLTALSHWPWQDPPALERVDPVTMPAPAAPGTDPARSDPVRPDSAQPDPARPDPARPDPARPDPARPGPARPDSARPDPAQPDLVVLSHLRWPWVWQRPQHLVSRLARLRAGGGARSWFVEEPVAGDVPAPELRTEQLDGVTRVWLVVPARAGQPEFLGFDVPEATDYGTQLAGMLADAGRPPAPDVWLYTPMAFDVAQPLQAGRMVYDVMDDLSSFRNASPGLRLRQRRLLADADVVFTGGRSLHRATLAQRRHAVHLFASGVETAHYAASRTLRQPRERKVAGYVGVIDERLDLDLLARLAAELPDWTIRVVGPVAKIEESSLPRAATIEYAGMTPYERLPEAMAGFDVALMPFALNDATRSISPTKTLEYLAAGLPVVSTRVPDVVADYSGVVHLADDGAGFAAACREVVQHSQAERDRLTRPIQARQEWDAIAAAMAALLDQQTAGARAGDDDREVTA